MTCACSWTCERRLRRMVTLAAHRVSPSVGMCRHSVVTHAARSVQASTPWNAALCRLLTVIHFLWLTRACKACTGRQAAVWTSASYACPRWFDFTGHKNRRLPAGCRPCFLVASVYILLAFVSSQELSSLSTQHAQQKAWRVDLRPSRLLQTHQSEHSSTNQKIFAKLTGQFKGF